ncbi:MAG: hypothetical protein Q9165_008880 [Trypethelium subeluteriae]
MATLPDHVRVGVNFPSSSSKDRLHAYFIVDSDDLIVAKWSLLRPEIIHVIKELPWAILSVVRGSYNPILETDPETNALILDEFEPAEPRPESNAIILIGAPSESQASWQTLAEQVYVICSNAGLVDTRVLIESVKYPLMATNPIDPSSPEPIEAIELARNVPMGSGFGPVKEDVQISASMGGTIELQGNDKKPSELLLSVFHPFVGLMNGRELSQGYRHEAAETVNLKMPSAQDIKAEREACQGFINDARAKIQLYNDKFDWTGEERYRDFVANLEKTIEKPQTQLQKLDGHTSGHQGLGRLQYGSGLERGLDWSLSSFDDRKMDNIPPEMIEVNTTARKSKLYSGERFIWSTAVHINRPKSMSLVAKRGRSTGITVGQVNSLPSDLLISKSLNLKKDVGIEVRGILEKQVGFAREGDSGAWAMDTRGDWIGSVIGVHEPKISCNGACIALVLEAEKIVDDIEMFTGMKVTSPARRT